MEQTMTTSNLLCEACNVHIRQHAYEQHVNGKKHKIKQELYDKKHKTIFVTGTAKFSPEELKNVFKKYGEISKVQKQPVKPFAFIKYANKESVEKVLKARVFAGGQRLFVHRYEDNRYRQNTPENNIEKSRKLSETLSNTSQPEGEADVGPRLGVEELPVKLADLDGCPPGEDKLLWQVREFISQVELPAEWYESLNEVKFDVENLFTQNLPGSKILVFGSCGSMLAFKNSDVDLFLQTANGEPPKDFVRKEAKEMYKSRQFRIIARIPSARVPIVKFEHIKTGWQGDLTANSQLGVCNSQLIRLLVSLDPRIRPLVMLIKYWAKVCGVTGSHSKLTTYSLVMLVMFYLQQLDPPMLPSIAQLQQLSQHKQYSLGWECSFCDEEWKVLSECLLHPNNLSFRELLTGFFRFYHNFDFDKVICPLLGRSVPVKDFESEDGSDLPDEMLLYKEKLPSDPKCKFRTDVPMRVQDPFELCLNITRNVVERSFSVFREACKVSQGLCEREDISTLIQSLFSIDEESLDVIDDCVKLVIPFKEETDSSAASESAFTEWYELTKDAIILVFKEILKFTVDPGSLEVSSKVKKLESSKDVHTPMLNHSGDKSVFVCSGKANVWNSRRKMSRLMNSMSIALNAFEREVCISNSLYCPVDKNAFSFTLALSSLEELKKGGKGIEIKLNFKKCPVVRNPLIKGFIQFMRNDFKVFVLKAGAFINKVKKSSPVAEVKESLKELFDLKLANLPDLKQLKNVKHGLSPIKGKESDVVEKQNVLVKSLSKVEGSCGGKINHEHASASISVVSDEGKEPEQGQQLSTTFEKPSSKNDVENVAMKCKCGVTSTDKPSAETEKLINEFFKPKPQNQVTVLEDSNRSLENREVEKFNDLLEKIQKIETRSTFASDEVNPFLASIEKVALKSDSVESKIDKRHLAEFKTKDKEVENTDQVITDVKTGQYKNKEEGSGRVCEGIKVITGTKNESVCEEKGTEINENLPSLSQEKSDENKLVENEKRSYRDKVTNGQRSGTEITLQRPKIYSERPSKQRRPNRYCRSAPQQTAQSWPCPSWNRARPPSHQSWTVTSQPFTHSYEAGTHHRQQRHSSRSIQSQRKCYPDLFRDNTF